MSIDTIAIVVTLFIGFGSFWLGFAQQRSVIRGEARDEFRDLKQNQNLMLQLIRELQEGMKELKQDNKYLDVKIDKINFDLSSRMDNLNNKIDKVNSDLNSKIDKINSDLLSRMDNLNNKVDKINSDLSSRIDRLTDSIYSQKAS